MALVDHQIRARVESSGEENCFIDSFDPAGLTNIGYDLRAKKFYVSSGDSGKWSTEEEETVTLQPQESAFVESVEIVSMPTDLLGRIALKNSRIRQGLSLDAPIYQPGHKTRIYFRLTNVTADAVTLSAGERYATIIFEKLDGQPEHPYEGAFKDEFSYRGVGSYKDVYKHQVREIEKKKDDLKDMERTIYANVLVILTVFVALFSFLTVNISLSANSVQVEDYFVFNILLLGCISFLMALLKTLVAPKKRAWAFWIPAVLCFVAAFLIFYL